MGIKETNNQNREKRESYPTPGPVAVRVGALAGVSIVALGVRHAVVEETLCTLHTRGCLDDSSGRVCWGISTNTNLV